MAENTRIIVCLDAGHGGKDSGATKGSRHEADNVLKLVLAVGKKLSNGYSNVKVVYTRKTDIYESPSTKAANANDYNADYFFSFHRNSASATARGYETLVRENSGWKKRVASDFNDAFKSLGYKNRGTKVRTDLAVLNKTKMPAVLLECGFISNTADNKLFDNKFDEMVDKIVEVIAENCNLKKVIPKTETSKFIQGTYNKKVIITKENCPVRMKRSSSSKKIATLKKGTKIQVMYILANEFKNLWGSVMVNDDEIGYIFMGNCKKV